MNKYNCVTVKETMELQTDRDEYTGLHHSERDK